MLRHSLRVLSVAAVAAFALDPVPAAAVTPVSACQPLNKAGETYILTDNVTASGDCFVILADRITLDLGGHTVTGLGDAVGVWDGGAARTSTVVRNGTLTKFTLGIQLLASTRNTVRAVTASDNTIGLSVGPNSLVKDCIVQRNFILGIAAADGTQVEGCLIGGLDENTGNLRAGLTGGQRLLVTRNTVAGNGNGSLLQSGIVVGANSTLTHNTVLRNGLDGIAAGPRSLVSSNTSNENGQDGIHVACPATVTHNTALDNGALPINPPTTGNGCVVLHNTTSDGGRCSASALADC